MTPSSNIPVYIPGKLFIVIPYFNESEVIGSVISGLRSRYHTERIVIVDDGSAEPFPLEIQRWKLDYLRHCCNLGQGAALQTGIEFCLKENAEWIVTYDADGQHQPGDIKDVLQPLLNGEADIVFGSRFLGGDNKIPLFRMLALKVALQIQRLITGVTMSDYHNGFRAMNRTTAQALEITQNRMAHASQIVTQVINKGLRWKEVQVQIKYTKYSLRKGQKLLDGVLILTDLFRKR